MSADIRPPSTLRRSVSTPAVIALLTAVGVLAGSGTGPLSAAAPDAKPEAKPDAKAVAKAPAKPQPPLPTPDAEGWITLIGEGPLEAAWKTVAAEWTAVSDVKSDPANPKRFTAVEGKGVWYNGPKGNARDLVSRQNFGDVEIRFDFNLPKGSNSGIKFHAWYEVQLFDSHGAAKVDGTHLGGVYPRAEFKPRYHHIDDGIAPLVNAAKAPGEWQTFEAVFRAPRFDAKGEKIADARLDKVVINGQVVQKDTVLKTPTGHNWTRKEVAEGPFLLQADHGPVAIRNMKVRPVK